MCEQFRRRKWAQFAAKPEAAVVPVVREFYANAKEQYSLDRKKLTSLVRGQVVEFDRDTINAFYGLEDVGEDEYSAWLATEPNGDEVLQLLAVPGGHWNMRNDKILTLSKASMTVDTKAWHYFICGKMVPSNHYSDATKDRAFLNYALQTGLSVNVGTIIEQSIISHLTGRVTGGLGHPSLIYQLCLKVGVVTSSAEEVHHPSPMITHRMLKNLERQSADVSAEDQGGAGLPETNEADPSSRPRTARRPARGPEQAPPPSGGGMAIGAKEFQKMQDDLRDTREELKEVKRELRSLKARDDLRHEQQSRQFDYLRESMQVMATLIQSMSSEAGSSSFMPSPPRFAVYPPPTPSSEEEEEDDRSEE